MKTKLVFIVGLLVLTIGGIYFHFFSKPKLSAEDADEIKNAEIVQKYSNAQNENDVKGAGEILIDAVKQDPNSMYLNYRTGKHFEEIGYFHYPFMTKYYLKYLELTGKNGNHHDEVVFSLAEYFIFRSIQTGDPSIISGDNKEKDFSTLNVSELLDSIKNKKQPEYLVLTGLCELIRENYTGAIEKLGQVSPDQLPYKKSKWIYNNLGYALIKNNNLVEAERALRIAVSVDPDNAYAHVNLGYVFYHTERYSEALIEYKKALVLDPKNEKFKQAISDTRLRIKWSKSRITTPTEQKSPMPSQKSQRWD